MLLADEMAWLRVLVLYLSGDVSENPSFSKGTEFMEYVKNRALNLNVIIISLIFFSGSCIYNTQRKHIQNTHMSFKKKLELGVRDY